MITKPFTIKHLMPPADILCLWAKPRWRSILREEEFGAIKTLKRLDHKNPSVGIDDIYDYQVTYNKRWQIQSFLSVHVFIISASRTPPHSWPAAATWMPNHHEMLSFGWIIDYDLANTFHQSFQVLSSLWDSTPELASNQTVIQHIFLVVNSFLQ
jgi:hypothetical protein